MNLISLLAAATEPATAEAEPLFNLQATKQFLFDQISVMHWLHALLLLSVGVVYILYGWRIFRALVVISFGFIGMFLGMLAGDKIPMHDQAVFWGGLVGMILLAALAIPLMKWCVSVLGAISGGILTSGIWIALNLSDTYLPAGFIVGFIAGGLISFIMLKVSVMLFTSLSGSLVMVGGMLGLLHLYDTSISEPATTYTYDLIFTHQWFLPMALIVPTLAGMFLQHKLIKHSPKWDISKS